ncbi:3-oxoacyl-ACP synthase [Streptomyces cinereospinus]|uniref:3-oxoacyl-ACP synthase n=1 Tax=Streptomyces cinereospinus TaxID=285561 RepID=A0ABV5MXC8_9ACTN
MRLRGRLESAPRVFLEAPAYVLGEIETHHSDIPSLADRARELRMMPDPSVWGWGFVHRTRRSVAELAIDGGRATLLAAGSDGSDVDAFVLCSTRFPGSAMTHGAFLSRVMTALGLAGAAFYGVTLNRCANLLAALRLAEALVTAGTHRRVLVVTADRVQEEAERITDFALFSDGAAGCLVTAEPPAGTAYRILGGATAQDPARLDWSEEISADLSRRANDTLLSPLGMTTADVAQLFATNLYRPVTLVKERQAGFTTGQIFAANIERVAHCFAADPLVNLVDRAAAGGLGDGGHAVLAASVPGSRTAVLIRQTPVSAS